MQHGDYECRECGSTFDVPDDADRQIFACPDCGSTRWRLIPQVCSFGIIGVATDWSHENNGKGRRISQLDYGVRQPYYAKNQQAAIDEASRRGLHAHKT